MELIRKHATDEKKIIVIAFSSLSVDVSRKNKLFFTFRKRIQIKRTCNNIQHNSTDNSNKLEINTELN